MNTAYDTWKTTDWQAEQAAADDAARDDLIESEIAGLTSGGLAPHTEVNMVEAFLKMLERLQPKEIPLFSLTLTGIYKSYPALQDRVDNAAQDLIEQVIDAERF